MNFDTDTDMTNYSHRMAHDDKAKNVFADIQLQAELAVSKLPKHRELLDKIYQHGLQKL